MRLLLLLFSFTAFSACSPMAEPPAQPAERAPAPTAAIAPTPADKLFGHWEVERIDDIAFPKQQGIVNFQSDVFFSHEAGCGGGHPAFFEAGKDGSFRAWRREAVIIGKCEGPRAAELERLLANFIDRADGWVMPAEDRLVLRSAAGSVAYLKRPVGPVPELEGQWRVLSIGGRAWEGPGTASVTVSYNWFGAAGPCNSGGAGWSSPGPGQIRLASFMSTQVACESEQMLADGRIFSAVSSATGYRVLAPDRVELTGGSTILLERAD